MTHRSRSRLRATVLVLFVLIGAVVPLTGATSAGAAPATVTIDGRGWGHGRGLSQYGALGHAVDHNWDWRTILGHYYSNTTEGNLGAGAPMSVRLTALDAAGANTIVVRDAGRLRTSVTGDAESTAWRVAPAGGGYQVYQGASCAGPWTAVGGVRADGEVRIYAANPADDSTNHADLLSVCEPSGWRRWYRGDIRAVHWSDGYHTVNHITMERYLRGVVPRESPASWGSAGGGKGMQALRAQAVAARSFAAAEGRYGYAKSCDTSTCQVYLGAFHASPGGVPVWIEHPNTDQAITDTSGVVRIRNGVPARTEFGSSSGGWTAGGTFPAVEDLGDAYSGNPNHTWRSELKVSAIESRYPQIGQFTEIQVIRRNNLGPDGGRVLEVAIRGRNGSVSLSGDAFRSAFSALSNCASTTGAPFCIKSDWFTPYSAPSPAAAVAVASTGYWVARVNGVVEAFEGATWRGDMRGQPLAAPILGMAATPQGSGYWLVASDGGIFSFEAGFHGSTGNLRLNQPVVGMASTRSGNGYWLVARDGGVFSFGDAAFHGSTGGIRLNQPIVGMARTATGNGYWLVASDGGIFAFGDARFHGSTGATRLDYPIVAMAPTPSGNGYWLLARDGGIFNFGDAGFHGSLSGYYVTAVGMSPTRSGNGYWIVTANDGAHLLGDR